MGLIKKKIEDQLVAESDLLAAYRGIPGSTTLNYPYAEFVVEPAGDIEHSVNQTYDENHQVTVEIWADSFESAEEISEQVTGIWKVGANFTQLTDLDVVNMQPSTRFGPFENEQGQKFIAIVLFDMRVRYTTS